MRLLLFFIGLGLTWFVVQSVLTDTDIKPAKIIKEVNLHDTSEPNPVNKKRDDARQKIIDLFNDKQFRLALLFVQKELKLKDLDLDYRVWLERQLPILYTTIGWEHVQKDECDEAIPLFEKAFQMNVEPFAIKGLGTCEYRRQNYWQAELYLRKFIQRQGFDYDAFLVLIDTLESLYQFDSALTDLEIAIRDQKLSEEEKETLSKRLSAMKEKNQESQHQTTINGTYIVLTFRAVEHAELGPWALEVMEQAIDEFYLNFSLARPTLTIEVVLYSSDSFKKLAHSPIWVSGLFDGRIRIPVAKDKTTLDKENLKRTLRHELTHALLSNMTGGKPLPTWFQEGLATLLECNPYCVSVDNSVSRGKFLPISTLEGSFLNLSSIDARQAYAQSFFLIQTIIKSEGMEAIRNILENIQGVTKSSQDLLRPLNASLDDLYTKASNSWISQK